MAEQYAREHIYDESMVEPDLPPPPGTMVGHWRYQLYSPVKATRSRTGRASARSRFAFWIDANGRQTIVTGERNLSRAPESLALGWSPEDAALVFLPHGACGGSAPEPGIYRYFAPGEGELINSRR